MTLAQFVGLNERVRIFKRANSTKWFYLSKLRLGNNETTLSTAKFVSEYIGADTDPRFKDDRNTIVNITLSNWDRYLARLFDALKEGETKEGKIISLCKIGETYVSLGILKPFKMETKPKMPTWANIEGWTDEDGILRSLTWFDQAHLYELGTTAARHGISVRVVSKEDIEVC